MWIQRVLSVCFSHFLDYRIDLFTPSFSFMAQICFLWNSSQGINQRKQNDIQYVYIYIWDWYSTMYWGHQYGHITLDAIWLKVLIVSIRLPLIIFFLLSWIRHRQLAHIVSHISKSWSHDTELNWMSKCKKGC